MFAPPDLGAKPSHDPIRLADWIELNLLMEEEFSVSVTSVADELASIPPDDSSDSERSSEGFRDMAEEKLKLPSSNFPRVQVG